MAEYRGEALSTTGLRNLDEKVQPGQYINLAGLFSKLASRLPGTAGRSHFRDLAFVLSFVRGSDMTPKDKGLGKKDDSERPLENQPLEWADEDREIEDRKPDLGEIEEDTSEL